MPQDYVYLPVWLVVVLVFLASGAVQYALIGAVKLVLRLTREHSDRFVDPAWAPRWQQIADWRKAHGGVSGGVNAKRRQGRGHAARRTFS